MPRSSAAAARTARTARPRPAAPRAVPRGSRRVSGPLRPAPAASPAAGALEKLRALPEHRVVDRLLRSRAWIWLIGVLLLGIVGMQVSLLKLNSGISRAVTSAGTLERQNSELRREIARLSSTDKVRGAAAAEGLVDPPAGDVEYLTARPERDGARAVRRMLPPSAAAIQVMDNGGLEPGVLIEEPVVDPAVVPADPAAVPADPAVVPVTPEG